LIKFEFEESQRRYDSGSQMAKAWTERWAADWLYCMNCGHERIHQLPSNMPVADFFCSGCGDQYELKSQKKAFGRKVADGAYETKINRLVSDTGPNLILLRYDLPSRSVVSVDAVPKHFFVPSVIEKRKPLAATARRAGWIGSNILLERIPQSGMIPIVRSGMPVARDDVLAQWKSTTFLAKQKPEARGWLVDVMRCVDSIGQDEFSLAQIYSFENELGRIYPENNNIRAKIRQQLQILRDTGYIEFAGAGEYRHKARS